jgi:transglutaminase-like putative cysteine protease
VSVDRARLLALSGVAALTLSYASVLHHVADVTGGSTRLLAVLGGSLVLGVAMGRVVGPRTAGVVTLGVGVAGFGAYVLSVPPGQRGLLFTPRVVADTVALLSGLSVLRLTNAGVWALGVAPGPVVLSWYLAVRRRYVWSVVAGGAALALLVLTGNAGPTTTLVGVAGAAGAVGAGEAERTGASVPRLDGVVAVVAAMVVVSATLSVAASGGVSPLFAGGGGSPTVESSVVEAEDNVRILGNISLSPQVRFEVESPEGEYWQTAAYDRYTGDGWVRTGETSPYDRERPGPPGAARTVSQRVTARSPLGSLPAAWRPVDVDGVDALVTPQGGLRPATGVATNESYTVRSRVPRYTTAQLRRAGTDYPARVESTYTALPGSTPDRVRERAAQVTADAETPYDRAVAVERHLEREKRYSLDVDEPSGSIADSFLFEMDAGYCTYYATTMVTMLRSQGVPARFVVGYTTGEPAGGDEYVVRGLDSHAWVQVYFPDVGWVRFDPTPAAPREAAEQRRLAEAETDGTPGIGTNTTGAAQGSDTDVVNLTATTPLPDTNETLANTTTTNETATPLAPPETEAADGGGLPDLPPTRTLAVWAVAAAGLLAVGRRAGVVDRLRESVGLRRQSRSSPDADAVRAYDRLETLFERRHRGRERGETPRAYVEAMVAAGADPDARVVVDAYERARHGDGVDAETADRAVETVDRLVRTG